MSTLIILSAKLPGEFVLIWIQWAQIKFDLVKIDTLSNISDIDDNVYAVTLDIYSVELLCVKPNV